jgi:glycine/D-amino acid oxidase-like deaminating enzyme
LPSRNLEVTPSSTPVLIVGGGVTGLSAAMFLSWRGVPNVLMGVTAIKGSLRTPSFDKHLISLPSGASQFRMGFAASIATVGFL